MKIQQIFFKNALRNFSYLLRFSDGAIYCIDPMSSREVIETIHHEFPGEQIKSILITHGHCDHFSGNDDLVKYFGCNVLAHAQSNIPGKNQNLNDGEVIYCCDEWSLESIYTPGHTLEHICFLLKKNNQPYALFTGDCLFNAGVGNCHNGGDASVLFETISHDFSNWPDELLIYPGHEYLKRNLLFTVHCEADNVFAKNFLKEIEHRNLDEEFFISSMETERKMNVFLRLQNSTIKKTLDLTTANSKEVFLKLRQWRDKW